MKFLPVLFGILVAETGIADFENGVWTNGYATSDNQDGFFILKRYEYDVEGGYCNFNVAATGTVRLEEILCYELTTGSTYEDEFYSFAVPRCRALDRFYDDAFETDGTLADDAKAFTIFEKFECGSEAIAFGFDGKFNVRGSMRYRFRFRSFAFIGANNPNEFDMHLVCDINICLRDNKKMCVAAGEISDAFTADCNAGYACFGVFC